MKEYSLILPITEEAQITISPDTETGGTDQSYSTNTSHSSFMEGKISLSLLQGNLDF